MYWEKSQDIQCHSETTLDSVSPNERRKRWRGRRRWGTGERGGGGDSDSKITASLAILCRRKEHLQFIPVLEYCDKIPAVYKITFVH